MVENLSTVWETGVQSLGQDDPLEEGMAAHSSILAWRIPWTQESHRLQSRGCKESDTTERLNTESWERGRLSSCIWNLGFFPNDARKNCPFVLTALLTSVTHRDRQQKTQVKSQVLKY